MVWAMTIPLRSWLLGSVGALLGCGFFVVDSIAEQLGPSGHNLHVWVETLEFSLFGPGLGIVCLLLVERVRTLREAANLQKFAERERRFILLGRMAASVAHEVRNPLHTLRLVVDELRVEQPALRSHPLSAHIDQSLERIDRAVDLVYQLARPGVEDDNSGDVVAALQEARTNLDRRHLSHRIEVHELPARALARCTPSGLRIIIDNLLRNATEAAPPGSVIDVHLREQHGTWILSISNPGQLPVELLESGATLAHDSTKISGLGLGLLITRHLASNAGGSLELTSSNNTVTAQLTLPTWEGAAR
jgi:signal transduction histidine kinase